MARGTPGPIVAAVSGTIGGAQFAQSGARLIIKKPRRKCPRTTPRLDQTRVNFTHFVYQWRTQTDDQRLQWATCAAQVNRRHAAASFRPFTGRTLAASQFLNFCGIFTLDEIGVPLLLGRPNLQIADFTQNATAWDFSYEAPPGIAAGITKLFALRSYATSGIRRRNYVFAALAVGPGPDTLDLAPILPETLGLPEPGEWWSFQWQFYETTGLWSLPARQDLQFI